MRGWVDPSIFGSCVTGTFDSKTVYPAVMAAPAHGKMVQYSTVQYNTVLYYTTVWSASPRSAWFWSWWHTQALMVCLAGWHVVQHHAHVVQHRAPLFLADCPRSSASR